MLRRNEIEFSGQPTDVSDAKGDGEFEKKWKSRVCEMRLPFAHQLRDPNGE